MNWLPIMLPRLVHYTVDYLRDVIIEKYLTEVFNVQCTLQCLKKLLFSLGFPINL